MDRYIGKTLDGRYTIEEVIGVGGMAVVYKTMDSRLNRYVALKVLKEEYAVDRDFRRRFHNESQAVAMLSHPNIVTVYDVSRTENTEYIVMELIDGINLKDYMRKRGSMSWKEITFFCCQIAKALEHAHSRGIIHRDIKPQNIMLLRDGTVKVADFGIARHVSKQDTYNMGEAIGSVHYVSPEQARGSFIDNRADLYSFGVVMYEMLTGRLPFEGDTPIAVALQHINSIALPPTDFVPDIPPALEAITMKAMNPNLNKRYTSATEMLADLESYRNDPNFTVTIIMDDKDEMQVDEGDDTAGHTRRINNTGEVEKLMAASKGGQGKNGGSSRRGQGSEPGRPRRRSRDDKPDTSFPTSIIFSLLAVVLFFAGAIYFMVKVIDPFGNPEVTKYSVPNLIGENASDILANADKYPEFTIVEGQKTYSDIHDAGTVINQDPAPNRKEDKGTVITLQISLGAKSFKLDDYTDMELPFVEVDFVRKGLATPIVIREENDEVEANRVIRTEPVAGADMTPGDQVKVYVSLGRPLEMVEVPELKGMTLDEARAALEENKLGLGQVFAVDSDEEADTIVFQFIPAGSNVEEGGTVDVNISRGPAETEPSETTEPSGPSGTTDPVTPPTTEPPTNPGYNYGDGNYMLPESYKNRTDLIYVDFPITVAEVEGSVSIKVYVDNYLQYIGTHVTSDGQIYVRLTAPKGERQVRVYQKDDEYYNATINFQ